jgi:hypothetical protein
MKYNYKIFQLKENNELATQIAFRNFDMIQNIFKPPFYIDEYRMYIFNANYYICFNILTEDEFLCYDILDVMNNKKINKKYDNIRIDDEYLYINDLPVLLVRGWGYLTGIGGLHLSIEDAIKAQKELLEYVKNKLEENYGRN